MPFWLIPAISIFWGIHACNVAVIFLDYAMMTNRQRRLTEYTAFAKALLIVFVPFTVFWWSYIIWG